MRPSCAYDHERKIDSPPATHDPEKWGPVFGPDHTRRREAKRRKAHANHVRAAPTNVAVRRRHLRGCAPFSEARPPSGASTAALTTGYYPNGSAPEPGFLKARRAGVLPVRRTTPRVKHAPCGPVFLPADRCPRAARERIASIRARAPHPAPLSESALAKGVPRERDSPHSVTKKRTFVKCASLQR
jgi:hypothetical protein